MPQHAYSCSLGNILRLDTLAKNHAAFENRHSEEIDNGDGGDVRIFQNMNLFGEIEMVALMAICLDCATKVGLAIRSRGALKN